MPRNTYSSSRRSFGPFRSLPNANLVDCGEMGWSSLADGQNSISVHFWFQRSHMPRPWRIQRTGRIDHRDSPVGFFRNCTNFLDAQNGTVPKILTQIIRHQTHLYLSKFHVFSNQVMPIWRCLPTMTYDSRRLIINQNSKCSNSCTRIHRGTNFSPVRSTFDGWHFDDTLHVASKIVVFFRFTSSASVVQ